MNPYELQQLIDYYLQYNKGYLGQRFIILDAECSEEYEYIGYFCLLTTFSPTFLFQDRRAFLVLVS